MPPERETEAESEVEAEARAALSSQARRWWLLAGGAALAYGISLRQAPYPDQAAAKVLMCALLVLATATSRQTTMRERGWLGLALAASAVGDALLALPQLSFSFVGGLGAFLLAHLAYCGLLVPLAGPVRGWRRVALPLLWAAALGAYAVFFPHLGELVIPVAVYEVALCLMASFALLASVPGTAAAVAGGGLAFVVSDTMIGIDRFVGPFAGSGYAIWFSYALAQVALSAGILFARRR
ncbi:lysoplasmalogenase [Trinickia fusca]|uniref:Lysoplasmalogenase n=1 Tax=Trinickia fusca TaxID=2419777 RepID=A0A494XT96_9BURK|nr:lysoplasmalogenase [Trinickia fusca]